MGSPRSGTKWAVAAGAGVFHESLALAAYSDRDEVPQGIRRHLSLASKGYELDDADRRVQLIVLDSLCSGSELTNGDLQFAVDHAKFGRESRRTSMVKIPVARRKAEHGKNPKRGETLAER